MRLSLVMWLAQLAHTVSHHHQVRPRWSLLAIIVSTIREVCLWVCVRSNIHPIHFACKFVLHSPMPKWNGTNTMSNGRVRFDQSVSINQNSHTHTHHYSRGLASITMFIGKHAVSWLVASPESIHFYWPLNIGALSIPFSLVSSLVSSSGLLWSSRFGVGLSASYRVEISCLSSRILRCGITATHSLTRVKRMHAWKQCESMLEYIVHTESWWRWWSIVKRFYQVSSVPRARARAVSACSFYVLEMVAMVARYKYRQW